MRRFALGLSLVLLASIPAAAERVKLTVLATTDLHGNLYPFDYYANRPANRGLAKIASLIRAERAANPNTLLIDCGDTIQGTPLEYVYQNYVRNGRLPLKLAFAGEPLQNDPMMQAMNAMGYDAMVVGNHEFNFGLKNLDKARAEARFPWLAANAELTGPDATPFASYLIKTVSGVKVAIIGVTTPAIPSWEKPENISRYRFVAARAAVERSLKELRALPDNNRPDLILLAAHAGLERDPKTGATLADGLEGENPIYDIATNVPGIDAIVYGHTHSEAPEIRLNGVLLTQPKNWGISLAELTFELESKPGGGFTVTQKNSRVIPVTNETEPDAEIMRIAKPYHELAERYLNTPVAQSSAAIDAGLGRVQDSALIDAVHAVQLHDAKADVSFTALFNPRISFPKGPVTVRQIAGLYIYDNELYAVEGNGKMVTDALETAARFYLNSSGATCRNAQINPKILGFNYDMAEGVNYEIDVTQPEGERIRNLTFKGKPLPPDQKLRIAINNYRAGGSAGYTMFKGAKILWRSGDDLRDLIIAYYTEHKTIPVKATGNWRIIPAEARQSLERQAIEEARRNSDK